MKLRDFRGKKIIVTGAASGIGKELARLFVEAGATVVLFDINKQGLEKTAVEFANRYNRKVHSMEVDVADYGRFKAAVDEVVARIGLVDIFVNNAGIGVAGEFVANSVEEIDAITGVNYLGMVYGSRIILEHFYKQGYGHLVNVASVAGLQGFPRMSLYCGAKFGIVGFSQSIRFELRRRGIHLSVAMPSTTATPMILDKLDSQDGEIPGILLAIPVCKTEDVARAIFKGIKKRRFQIFPTFTDRMTLYMRNFAPGLFNIFISVAGFKDYKRKREKLKKEYGKVSVSA